MRFGGVVLIELDLTRGPRHVPADGDMDANSTVYPLLPTLSLSRLHSRVFLILAASLLAAAEAAADLAAGLLTAAHGHLRGGLNSLEGGWLVSRVNCGGGGSSKKSGHVRAAATRRRCRRWPPSEPAAGELRREPSCLFGEDEKVVLGESGFEDWSEKLWS